MFACARSHLKPCLALYLELCLRGCTQSHNPWVLRLFCLGSAPVVFLAIPPLFEKLLSLRSRQTAGQSNKCQMWLDAFIFPRGPKGALVCQYLFCFARIPLSFPLRSL